MDRKDITFHTTPLPGGGFRDEVHVVIVPSKIDEARTTDAVTAIITEPTFIRIMKEYIAIYDASPAAVAPVKPCTRLWRKVSAKADGGRYLIHQAIGKTPCAQVGKRLAALVGVDNSERVTGHWARRTAITLLAEGKFNIKCFTLIYHNKIFNNIIIKF